MIQIYAHRGANLERPENTMAAFKRARELGADGIEFDVYLLTKDGSLVIHHDVNMGRCENAQGRITEFDGKTIRTFSAGEKFSPEYKNEKVPFLSELLDYVKENPIFLNCEVESLIETKDHVAVPVMEMMEQYQMADNCIISCFNEDVLDEIKEKYPQYKVGWLFDTDDTDKKHLDYCIAHRFDAIHPNYIYVTPDYVRYAHKHGVLVNVWTPDSPEDIRRMKNCGVDGIITNDVLTAQRVLTE